MKVRLPSWFPTTAAQVSNYEIGRQILAHVDGDKHMTNIFCRSIYYTCNLVFTTSRGQVIVAPTVPPTLKRMKNKSVIGIYTLLLYRLKLQPKKFNTISITTPFPFGFKNCVFAEQFLTKTIKKFIRELVRDESRDIRLITSEPRFLDEK